MIRWLSIAAMIVLLFWPITLTALTFGGPALEVRSRGDLAAGLTVAAHLVVACFLRFTRRRPAAMVDPGWTLTQAEKHSRQGIWFASWGILAALAWFLVRPDPWPGDSIAWPALGVLAGNLGLQAGLLGTEVLVIHARVKLGRWLAASG